MCLYSHRAEWSDVVTSVWCCILPSCQAPKQSLHIMEICQPLIIETFYFFSSLRFFTKQLMCNSCALTHNQSAKHNLISEKNGLILLYLRCSAQSCKVAPSDYNKLANFGWLAEAGSKPRHQGSCDQSDQRRGSKRLIKRCCLDKLCKNLLFLLSSFTCSFSPCTTQLKHITQNRWNMPSDLNTHFLTWFRVLFFLF